MTAGASQRGAAPRPSGLIAPLENRNVNSVSALSPTRVAVLLVLAAAAGCSTSPPAPGADSKIDYRTASKPLPELEVPPDLTQLARESHYQQQTGVVSANAFAAQAAQQPIATSAVPVAPAAVPVAPAAVPVAPPTSQLAAARPTTAAPEGLAPATAGDVRLEHDGQTRWLVTPQSPEQVWPVIEAFWRDQGFTLPTDRPEIGTMETSWAENRALLPDDIVRRSIGSVLGSLYSTGLRDRFRTRVERGPQGTEIYIAHQGAEEVVYGQQRDLTIWQPRPSDPLLEAEMLSRLMLRLGGKPEAAKAVASEPAKPAVAPGRETVLPAKAEMELAESFDRAWRQIGLSLDRSGFTVEDRDRSAGLYFVRYVDPKQAAKEEPNFFAKLFSSSSTDPAAPQRYRVAVKGSGAKTVVSVQDSKGAPDNSENARRIIARLMEDVRR
jgi:outer membrane protein assembly factor BamC